MTQCAEAVSFWEIEVKAFFKNRYDASHAIGVKKLLSGTVPLFAGRTETMNGEMIVAIKLQEAGHRFSVLLSQLKDLERIGGNLFLAERDFPIHSTVQVAVGGHEAKKVLMSGFDLIKNNTFSFDRLVLDGGGNIVLMNEGVPAEVSYWRGWASQVMAEYGGQPKPLPIFHATVARIISLNYSTEIASQLLELVENWNRELQEEVPLLFVSKGTYVGNIFDLLKPS